MILKELIEIMWNAKKLLKKLDPSWRYKVRKFEFSAILLLFLEHL